MFFDDVVFFSVEMLDFTIKKKLHKLNILIILEFIVF